MTNEEFIKSISLKGEEWRDVVGYEDFYIVSNLGRIATKSTLREFLRNGKKVVIKYEPHICSTSIAPSTMYRRMTFIVNHTKHTQLVHRIVALAFLPNPNGYPVVDHINDDPTDNRASNLQWCTYKVNNSKEHHKKSSSLSHLGRIDPKRKPLVSIDANGKAIFFESMFEANKNGHSNSAILRVLRGKLHTHHGYKWMYLSDYENLVNQ